MATGKYQKWITEEGAGQIRRWCEDGATDEELMDAMGITSSTFYAWKQNHPEISEAIALGRGRARVQIDNALFIRAKGGVVTVMKQKKRRIREYDPDTGKCIKDEEIYEALPEEEYIAPDTQAIKFWLINRASDRWAEKVVVEGKGELTLEEVLNFADGG